MVGFIHIICVLSKSYKSASQKEWHKICEFVFNNRLRTFTIKLSSVQIVPRISGEVNSALNLTLLNNWSTH